MIIRDVNRFPLALVASLVLNVGLWATLSKGAERLVAHRDLPPIEVQRIVIDDKGHKEVKVVKPEEIKKKVVQAVKEPPKKPQETKKSPPPDAHNKIITAPAKTGESKTPPDFAVKAGGNASVGKPTDHQGAGDAKVNPPVEPPKDPPKVDPPKVDPPKTDPPKTEPPKIDPPKVDPPRPKGPTKDAEPERQVDPKIPDSLKSQELKTFVRVKVEIQEDGQFNVILRTSSGNADVDKLILDALQKWRWKPALKDGVPVRSTQLFRFDIEVK